MTIFRNFFLYFKNPRHLSLALVGLAFLGFSVWLNFTAGTYAYNHMSNGVADLLLDNLPTYDVSLLFIEGAAVMVLGIFVMCVVYPQRFFDVTATIALMYLFRAGAISLTHLGPPLAMGDMGLANTITGRFVQGADYFFSGHTALPFLAALLFWEKTWVRNIYLACTLIFGVAAILGHLHYSIDVFAAPFIAYGIYAIRRHLWKVDSAVA